MGRKSVLPEEFIEVAHRHGLGGRRVYIPKQTGTDLDHPPTLVNRYLPEVLREIESAYETRGVTFYLETSSERIFSGMFSKSRVATQFRLKPRTATRVLAAARKAWRDWFSRSERLTLDHLRTIGQEFDREYTPIFLSYLEIRSRLRKGQEVTISYYGDYHRLPDETIRQMIALAQSSIESCPWRNS
ncbi:MAG: hypothetical protein HZA19_03450 [Nitrospirae bacterium]|nr:hypothetical protein [Nitrospirota bacterium]